MIDYPVHSIVYDINASTGKVAYLTFDDGPSKVNSPKILDILAENKIKASFFVVCKMAESNKAMIIRENAEGNAVLNHSYSHDYKYDSSAKIQI